MATSSPFSIGSIKEFAQRWLGVVRDGKSDGGESAMRPVNVDYAMQISTAWACAKLISESIGTLPLFLYDKRGNKRKIADTHPLNFVIHTQPNEDSTSTTFWQVVVFSMIMRGRAYVEKDYGVSGSIIGLEFLSEDNLSKVYDGGGEYHYRYYDPRRPGTVRDIPKERMWYLPNITMDGREGVSPISCGAASFRNVVDANDASTSIFKRGLRLAGVVNVDKAMNPEQREQMRTHVTTVSREGGYLIMEKGQGYNAINMTPNDAELLSSRRYGVEEVCRWFGVPPFMVGHAAAGQTNWGSGIEQQMIGFVTFVLRPIAVRIEQGIRKDLLLPSEKTRYGAEFSLEGLMRGDSAARSAFYQVMVRNGIYTRDEVRGLENLDAMEGNAAVLTVESSMIPLDKLGANQTQADDVQDALKSWLLGPDSRDNQPRLNH